MIAGASMASPVEWLTALLLGGAAAFAAWRTWRSRRSRRAWFMAAQVVVAALLYLVLFPPSSNAPFVSGELVVLTPGLSDAERAALPHVGPVVALPGVAAPAAVERVPDLGTALRRHPDSRRIVVVGGGLPARDRDAARGLVARFDAAPLPAGIVELSGPGDVRAGHRFRIEGRVENARGGRVELRDPAAVVVATSTLDDDGRFALSGVAKVAGNALFDVRAFDVNGAQRDEVAVPVAARAGDALKLLVLAGAPGAELKYLRRWAVDAGVALDSRITLSPGVAVTEGIAPASAQTLDAASLRTLDMVVIDERAWLALDVAAKAALTDAVHAGLGLMLRVTGAADTVVATDFAKFGFALRSGDATSAPLSLANTLALEHDATTFTAAALTMTANDAAELLHDDDHRTLAAWRAVGAGRVAVWRLADSYRLVLAGHVAAFGALWSDTLATLARARGARPSSLPDAARVGERATVCDVAADAAVVDDDASERTLLLAAPTSGDRVCAGYWPARSGWHTLISAGERQSFDVRDSDAATALARGEDARATQALLTGAAHAGDAAQAMRATPLPRWPFFIAWLLAAALLWIGERRPLMAAAAD